jgi:hypothetical protein
VLVFVIAFTGRLCCRAVCVVNVRFCQNSKRKDAPQNDDAVLCCWGRLGLPSVLETLRGALVMMMTRVSSLRIQANITYGIDFPTKKEIVQQSHHYGLGRKRNRLRPLLPLLLRPVQP